jgi:aspartyl aminopeptidase
MKVSDFLDKAPTAWHACHLVKERLLTAGFEELREKESWKILPGRSYFVERNGSSLMAFHTPRKGLERAIVVGAHTDSPCLKLKPLGDFSAEETSLLNFEVYGSPILASWVGRDLYLAGRVFYQDRGGKPASKLVSFPECPITIPHVAIHLDRQVNETGLLLNKQEHLSAILSTSDFSFDEWLGEKLDSKKIIYKELFAVPFEGHRFLGANNELLASARLDNLVHVASATEALLAQKPDEHGVLQAVIFWNHEEVGSVTQEGAASSFYDDVMHRIALSSGLSGEDLYRLKARSLSFSCDVAHAVHPNYPEKHDPRHRPKLGKGIVIKTNAQERYASNAPLTAQLIELLQSEKIEYQFFTCRNDIPCGTTIGPIHASTAGVRTIDLGIPLLGMHAARELICIEDYSAFTRMLKSLFATAME